VKITEKTFDAITGEETITEREETATEKTEREQLAAKIAANTAAAEAAAVARAVAEAKLAALGLTTDDLKALGL
jgi:hypothetical protein